MKRLFRVLLVLTYPFLVLSALLVAGMAFGAAFIADFTVENHTDQPLVITPVGTIGPEGSKASLPVTIAFFPHLPALRAGGFLLQAGEAVTIHYDWDDINFSEIMVEDEQGRQYQLVTDPKPTQNQYHGPLQRRYVLEDLRGLAPVNIKVREAAAEVRDVRLRVLILPLLLVGPWLAFAGLRCLLAQQHGQRTDA